MKLNSLLLSLLFTSAGFSQTISTEAPSVSAGAVTVPKGFLQGELSSGFYVNKDGSETITASNESPFLLLRFGISDRIELRMQQRVSYRRFATSHRFDYQTIGIGGKYAILPNDGTTNLAVIVNYSPYNNTWRAQQGDVTLAFSKNLGDKSSIGVNTAFSRYHLNDPLIGTILRTNSVLGSAVYSWQLNEKWTFFGEYYHSYSTTIVGENIANNSGYFNGVDFGVQFLLRDNIQLDWASGFNFSNREHFHSIGFNMYINTKK